jgi:hypothetical protein
VCLSGNCLVVRTYLSNKEGRYKHKPYHTPKKPARIKNNETQGKYIYIAAVDISDAGYQHL